MKVIHLIGGGDTGGAKTHVLNLLRELNNSIDARLFCFRKGDFSEDAEKMGIPIDVIESGNPVVGLRELKRLLAGERSRSLFRRLGQYGVTVYEDHFNALLRAGDLKMLEDGSAVLQNPALYSDITGLSLEADSGRAEFI